MPPLVLFPTIISLIISGVHKGISAVESSSLCMYTYMHRRTKLEPVRLSVTTRTGNKKATLIDNLDYYGISPTDVVHQVQRIAAASATGTCKYLTLQLI